MTEEVILVDENDAVTGYQEKLAAHREGKLHRAFSVFITDGEGRLLLQRRAMHKYHSAGLWTNTCCSHPRRGEDVAEAASRRLQEEMGFVCPLQPQFSFIYRAELENGLIEHELDHVLTGQWEGEPAPDAAEVMAWAWQEVPFLTKDIARHPHLYTYWFRQLLPVLVQRHIL